MRLSRSGQQISHSQSGNALIIGLLGVAVLAVLLWFLVLSPESGSEQNGAGSVVTGGDVTRPGPDGALSDASTTPKPGNEARAFIAQIRKAAQRPDLHDVHVRGVRFMDQGKPVDAYLLWFFAAREGHTPSALVLGEMYDPEYFTGATEVLEEPDFTQAYKWYSRAAEAGDPTAEERLSALYATVEQAAGAGDEDARRMLLRWR